MLNPYDNPRCGRPCLSSTCSARTQSQNGSCFSHHEMLSMYQGNIITVRFNMPSKEKQQDETAPASNASSRLKVERVQTGVRIEKRILKVLKAFAEARDITLGDLIEGIALHNFEG